MSDKLSPNRVADDGFEIRVDSSRQAQWIARTLRKAELAEDVVAGLETVCVKFAPASAQQVSDWLQGIDFAVDETLPDTPIITLDIHYGGEKGPDFEWVCEALNLSAEAFIEMHTGQTHTVEMMGFTPGFAYVSGLPEDVKIPRLSDPRLRVAAGSVGVSGAFTGIYALAGPGGWPLIGRLSKPLTGPISGAPIFFQSGQRLKFKAA